MAKHKNRLHRVLINCALCAIIFVAIGYLSIVVTRPPNPSEVKPYIPPTKKLPLYELTDTKTGNKILEFDTNMTDLILPWQQNYLFLISKNTDTNVVSFSPKDHSTIKTSFSHEALDMYGADIINNTLYISFGRYLLKGAIYYTTLPLTEKSTFTKLTDARNPSFEQKYGRYWIIGGEGDSCAGEQDYYTFDPTTREVNSIFTSKLGCTTGEELIGRDNGGNLIITYHEPLDIKEPLPQKYTYLALSTISNPTNKQMLITEDQMPANADAVHYIPEYNTVFISGDPAYIYKVDTKELKKTISTKNAYPDTSTVILHTGTTVCVYSNDKPLYAVDILSGNEVPLVTCNDLKNPARESSSRYQSAILREYKLPPDLKLK